MGDIKKMGKKIEKNFKELTDEVEKPFKEVGKGIEKGFKGIGDAGSEIWDGAIEGVTDVVGSIGGAGAQIAGEIAPYAGEIASGLSGNSGQQYAERKIASVPSIQTTQADNGSNNTMMMAVIGGVALIAVFMLTGKRRK